MQPDWLTAKRARLEVYVLKAEEAEKKAADSRDAAVRDIWAEIARARRTLAQRVADELPPQPKPVEPDRMDGLVIRALVRWAMRLRASAIS
jgi:hypothetical protein